MRFKLLILTFTTISLTGCLKEVSKKHFHREDDLRDMDRVLAMQSAAGARADGMLYPHHFSGTELNSLGRSKLHLMAADKPATAPLVVYVNTSNDPHAAARQSAVSKYLQEHGVAAADLQVKTGANPDALAPASAGLIRYSKTESGSPEGTVDSRGTNTGSVAPTVGGAR